MSLKEVEADATSPCSASRLATSHRCSTCGRPRLPLHARPSGRQRRHHRLPGTPVLAQAQRRRRTAPEHHHLREHGVDLRRARRHRRALVLRRLLPVVGRRGHNFSRRYPNRVIYFIDEWNSGHQRAVIKTWATTWAAQTFVLSVDAFMETAVRRGPERQRPGLHSVQSLPRRTALHGDRGIQGVIDGGPELQRYIANSTFVLGTGRQRIVQAVLSGETAFALPGAPSGISTAVGIETKDLQHRGLPPRPTEPHRRPVGLRNRRHLAACRGLRRY